MGVLKQRKCRVNSECGLKIQIEYLTFDPFLAQELSKIEKIPDLGKIPIFNSFFGRKGGQMFFDLYLEDRFGIFSSLTIFRPHSSLSSNFDLFFTFFAIFETQMWAELSTFFLENVNFDELIVISDTKCSK